MPSKVKLLLGPSGTYLGDSTSIMMSYVDNFSVGPPERPVNCSVVNQTTESLVVECLPGFDGGLDQLFHMEVTDLQTGQRIANTSQGGRAAPEFEVSGLNSGRCGYNGGTSLVRNWHESSSHKFCPDLKYKLSSGA